jgi:glyoxalase family protein
MTFFPWPGAISARFGTGQLTVTSFAVPEKSLGYWKILWCAKTSLRLDFSET